MNERQAREIDRERDRQRQLMVASLMGLAGAGLTAAASLLVWQWVNVPEVRALVWAVFVITAFFGLVGGVVAFVLQAALGLLFSRESGRKVAALVREAKGEEQRKTPA